MDKNYMSTVQGQMLRTPRLTALKHFPEGMFLPEHDNNLKWAILET